MGECGAEEWGVDANSVLRRATRELVGEALREVAVNSGSAKAAAARISARILNITARELEVDWYREREGAIELPAEEFLSNEDWSFDPKKTVETPSLQNQGVDLEVQFTSVNFPDPDKESNRNDSQESKSKGGPEEEAEDWIQGIMETLEDLNLTVEDLLKAGKNPSKCLLDVDSLRQIMQTLPTSDVIRSMKPRSSDLAVGNSSAHAFFRRFRHYPHVRECFESGVAMMTFGKYAKEAKEVLTNYSNIATEIVESEKLQTTLQTALVVFNRLLLKDGEEPAEGFALDVLPSLKTEPNPEEPERTLLSTLVRTLLVSSPGTLPIDDMPTLASEMMNMPKLDDVEVAVTELYNTLEGVAEFCEASDLDDPFVIEACQFLEGKKGAKRMRSSLVSMHGVLRMSLQRMMSFFGEQNLNSRGRQMQVILAIWNFTRDLDMAVIQAKIGDLTARLATAA